MLLDAPTAERLRQAGIPEATLAEVQRLAPLSAGVAAPTTGGRSSMAIFDSEIEQALQSLARSSQGTASTTTITPGPKSPYAGALEALAGDVGATGSAYADLIRAGLPSLGGEAAAKAFAKKWWPNYTWDQLPPSHQAEAWEAVGGKLEAPVYDAAGARERASAYGTLLDETGRPMLERGRASLAAGGPSAGIVGKLRDTAMDPIDDDLETYFRDKYREDINSELARVGLVGQGRGADLLMDAEERYAMQRREGADARRIAAGEAASRLTGADLDQALREITTGAGLTTAGYGARDAAEKDIYNFDLTTLATKATLPASQLMQLAQLGGAEASLRGAPANLWGTLYGLDQARLARGSTIDQASTVDLTRSGSESGSRITSPSALDSFNTTVQALGRVPGAVEGVGTLVSGAGKVVDAGKSAFDSILDLFSSSAGSSAGMWT